MFAFFFEWEEENLVRPLSLTGLTFGYAPDVSRRSRADCTKARENNIKHKEAKATVHTLYCCCVCTYRSVGRSGYPGGITSKSDDLSPRKIYFCSKIAIFGRFDREVDMFKIGHFYVRCCLFLDKIFHFKTNFANF